MPWIADAGAGQHLCSADAVPSHALDGVTPCPDIRLSTANGVIDAIGELKLHLPELGIDGKFILLEKCPPVLSTGRLVEDHGFQLHWKQGAAWFVTPDGRQVKRTSPPNVFQAESLSSGGGNPPQTNY